MEKIVMEKVVYDADLKLKNLVLVTQLNMVMQQVIDMSYCHEEHRVVKRKLIDQQMTARK